MDRGIQCTMIQLDINWIYSGITVQYYTIRVRLKIIGHLETMQDSDLPTFLIISLPIIFKCTVLVVSQSVMDHGCEDYTLTRHHSRSG